MHARGGQERDDGDAASNDRTREVASGGKLAAKMKGQKLAAKKKDRKMDIAGHKNNANSSKKNGARAAVIVDGSNDKCAMKGSNALRECEICCRESDLFAVGPCVHPICIECGIRLRILCKNDRCPKCRAVIDTMYFVPFSGDWSSFKAPGEYVRHEDSEKQRIRLANDYVAERYDSYLCHPCLMCEKKGEKRVFGEFAQLNQHMYMVHRLEYCDICVENLTLFTRERRFYSHLDLEKHIEHGDADDRSLKGHPQCLFCEKRFLDEEFRYKHLRKDHFFCQICDADGKSNYFFPEHKDLLSHYRTKHIVCEEGECSHLGIAFRTDTELKLHKSRDHAAGPQTLNLDLHFSNRNMAGPSRGGRAAPSTRSTLLSQRNIPKISVIPPRQPQIENKRTGANDVATTLLAQNERDEPPLTYRSSQFTLQESDFPRLGKSTRSDSTVVQNSKNISKLQKATSAAGVNSSSHPSEPNVTCFSSSSCFIDDDEQFPPHRPYSRTSSEQQIGNEHSESMGKNGDETKSISGISAIESACNKVMKRPQSLSNVATALAQNGFPSLPSPLQVATKPISSLPRGSVWTKKSRLLMQVPSNQINHVTLTAAAHFTENTRKNRHLPVPDLWPQVSVSADWEDRKDSSIQGHLPINSLSDVVTVKNASSEKKGTKRNKNKERNNSTQKRESQLSELLSSTFSSILADTTKKGGKKEPGGTTAIDRVNETSVDTSSFMTFPKLLDESSKKVLKEQNEVATEKYVVTHNSPPGLRSMDLAIPPGFGPPPGFDNTAVVVNSFDSEMQASSADVMKPSPDESGNMAFPKAAQRSGKKKNNKMVP